MNVFAAFLVLAFSFISLNGESAQPKTKSAPKAGQQEKAPVKTPPQKKSSEEDDAADQEFEDEGYEYPPAPEKRTQF
ncbi:hypothetical protein K2X33_07190 [bacterium]|nr:hypothetical protein [bacterium]